MKKTFFTLLTCSILLSCSDKKINELDLFNGITFKVFDNEKIQNIDSISKNQFDSLFHDKKIQTPLFKKFIQGENYKVFISLPFNITFKKLFTERVALFSEKKNFKTDSSTYFFYRHPNDSNLTCEFSRCINDNIIYIIATSTHTPLSVALFNEDSLMKRFNR